MGRATLVGRSRSTGSARAPLFVWGLVALFAGLAALAFILVGHFAVASALRPWLGSDSGVADALADTAIVAVLAAVTCVALVQLSRRVLTRADAPRWVLLGTGVVPLALTLAYAPAALDGWYAPARAPIAALLAVLGAISIVRFRDT